MSIRSIQALALVAGAVTAAGSASAAVIDQDHSPGSVFYNPLGPTYVPNQSTAEMAQTFTVGLQGTLSSVSVLLLTPFPVTVDLRIVPVVAGLPDTGTVLASASWSGTAGLSPISFDVSGASLAVNPGDELAFWLSASELSRWTSNSVSSYGGGSAFWRFPGATDGSPTSFADIGYDSYFQTYVEVIPTPGAAALLGLGGLAAVRRRR